MQLLSICFRTKEESAMHAAFRAEVWRLCITEEAHAARMALVVADAT